MTANSVLPRVSVVMPTHNPRMDYLRRVLEALRVQTLPREQWELVVIDNNSRVPLRVDAGARDQETKSPKDQKAEDPSVSASLPSHVSTFPPSTAQLDLSWHRNGRIVREERLGLTAARLRGFAETKGELLVLVDDDNVLDPDYLEQAVRIAEEFPFLGSWSGQSILEFEDPALKPPEMLRSLLLERHLDRDYWSKDRHHTKSDPYGAGMCVRRVVAEAYTRKLASEPKRMELDLSGEDLLYGGDLDLAFAGLDIGFGKGAFHRLKFTHLIPKSRCSMDYLMRAAEGHAHSEVIAAWLNGDRPPNRDATVAAKTLRWLRGLRHGFVYREFWKARHRGIAKAENKLRRS
jgi:glycosyltransferase involved in cell wall biosynthesis